MRNFPPSNKAFTLVELLVCLAIIGILAVLSGGAVRKVISEADNAKCVSNLRQIGTAISLYCNDHDGYLPGPAYGPMYLNYYVSTPVQNQALTSYLGPYLGMDETNKTVRICPILQCPSFKYKSVLSKENQSSAYSYASAYYLSFPDNGVSRPIMENGKLINPWGRLGVTDVNNEPHRLVKIQSLYAPSKVWAVRDMDMTVAGGLTGSSPTPTHKGHWNRLYFDFHVAPTTDSLP